MLKNINNKNKQNVRCLFLISLLINIYSYYLVKSSSISDSNSQLDQSSSSNSYQNDPILIVKNFKSNNLVYRVKIDYEDKKIFNEFQKDTFIYILQKNIDSCQSYDSFKSIINFIKDHYGIDNLKNLIKLKNYDNLNLLEYIILQDLKIKYKKIILDKIKKSIFIENSIILILPLFDLDELLEIRIHKYPNLLIYALSENLNYLAQDLLKIGFKFNKEFIIENLKKILDKGKNYNAFINVIDFAKNHYGIDNIKDIIKLNNYDNLNLLEYIIKNLQSKIFLSYKTSRKKDPIENILIYILQFFDLNELLKFKFYQDKDLLFFSIIEHFNYLSKYLLSLGFKCNFGNSDLISYFFKRFSQYKYNYSSNDNIFSVNISRTLNYNYFDLKFLFKYIYDCYKLPIFDCLYQSNLALNELNSNITNFYISNNSIIFNVDNSILNDIKKYLNCLMSIDKNFDYLLDFIINNLDKPLNDDIEENINNIINDIFLKFRIITKLLDIEINYLLIDIIKIFKNKFINILSKNDINNLDYYKFINLINIFFNYFKKYSPNNEVYSNINKLKNDLYSFIFLYNSFDNLLSTITNDLDQSNLENLIFDNINNLLDKFIQTNNRTTNYNLLINLDDDFFEQFLLIIDIISIFKIKSIREYSKNNISFQYLNHIINIFIKYFKKYCYSHSLLIQDKYYNIIDNLNSRESILIGSLNYSIECLDFLDFKGSLNPTTVAFNIREIINNM